eukprot:TCONS_00069676-protein
MENSESSNYSSNSSQPLLVSTVLSTNVLHAKIGSNSTPKDKLRRCKKCRKTFKNHGTYLSHVRFHKNNLKLKNRYGSKNKSDVFQQQEFQCKTCNATCTGIPAFLDHMKRHSDQQMDVTSYIADDGRNQLQNEEVNISDQTIELSQALSDQNAQLSNEELQQISALQQQSNAQQMVFPQGNAGLHIEIPSHIKTLSFNNSNNSNSNTAQITQLNTLMKSIESLHSKIDVVIKHLNIPLDAEGNPLPPATELPAATQTIEVNPQSNVTDANPSEQKNSPDTSQQHEQQKTDLGEETEGETAVLLEGFPPSYSLVQAAKEQQQQEFYALTLSGRNPQQLTQATSNDLKMLKGKTGGSVDFWVPSTNQHYILAEAQTDEDTDELTIPLADTPSTSSSTNHSLSPPIPASVIEKVFIESRSRANFAKNLTFAIYSKEERYNRNCTGRVFGRAQNKQQLDPEKLAAVKEATFNKYPCGPNLVDITWRKECITAIDSGLRNEHRASLKGGNTLVHGQEPGTNNVLATNAHHIEEQNQVTQQTHHQMVANYPLSQQQHTPQPQQHVVQQDTQQAQQIEIESKMEGILAE